MKFSLRYGISCIIILFLLACETVPDEMRVLEKSRQVEPAWMASGPGIRPSPEGIEYVLCKDKVLDLPLGLAQTEESILYNLKFQMYQLIMSNIDSASLSPHSAKDLHREISKILDKELTKKNLKDFYFDKVSIPFAENGLIPEYYRIYGLAQVDVNQRALITSAVKSYIKSYPNDDLRSQLKSVSQF